MSGESSASGPNFESPVDNPASNGEVAWIGCIFLFVVVVLFYALIASWPVLEDVVKNSVTTRKFKSFVFFGFVSDWEPDKRMLFTVVLAGAIGSLVHALTSFADFVGNRRFSANWIWWYALRLPIGAALAIFFYFIVRGGLLVPTVSNGSGGYDQQATLALNPYSIAAFAALAGMFARNASDKLSEVFDAVLARKEPVKRDDKLSGSAGLKTEPEKLTKGKEESLTIIGRGFKGDTEVKVAGTKRDFKLENDQIKIEIAAADVADVGTLVISVKNPGEAEIKKAIAIV